MSDRIFFMGIKVVANVGVKEREKKKKQSLEIDIEIFTDLKYATISDSLKDTINYSDVYRFVKKVAGDGTYNLIETIAGKICDEVLKIKGVQKVKVRVMKFGKTLKADFDKVGVEVERENR